MPSTLISTHRIHLRAAPTAGTIGRLVRCYGEEWLGLVPAGSAARPSMGGFAGRAHAPSHRSAPPLQIVCAPADACRWTCRYEVLLLPPTYPTAAVSVRMCIHMCVHTHACAYECICAYACKYACVCKRACAGMHGVWRMAYGVACVKSVPARLCVRACMCKASAGRVYHSHGNALRAPEHLAPTTQTNTNPRIPARLHAAVCGFGSKDGLDLKPF